MGEKRRNNVNKIDKISYNKQGGMMEIIENTSSQPH